MSALTGVVSVVLFLPCVFKEFSTLDKVSPDGNAGDDTTETLNIAEAEAMNANGSSLPKTSIKGSPSSISNNYFLVYSTTPTMTLAHCNNRMNIRLMLHYLCANNSTMKPIVFCTFSLILFQFSGLHGNIIK